MKKEKIMISGVLLALMIFIQACGLSVRSSYEKDRNQIYMSANASDIRESGLFFSTVLKGYKDAGVNFVTVSPKTVEDYEALGKLSAITYSSLTINEDAVSQAVLEVLSPYGINEKSTVVLSTDTAMTEYLRKNISVKYPADFFIERMIDEQTTVFAFPKCEDKNIVIGYDEEELYLINEAGMRPCLEYPSYTYENESYIQFARNFIEQYKPAFLIIRENENDNKTEISSEMKKILKNSEMSLAVMEKENQISNEKPFLYEELREIFGFNTMRGFNTDKAVHGDKTQFMHRYYQWYNSVLERNTTFLNINILKNSDIASEHNWNNTVKAIEKFKGKAESLGFEFPNETTIVPYRYNLQTSSMCGSVVILVLLYLYLSLLLGKKAEDKELYFLISCAILIIFSFAFYNSITKYYAMLIMILASSLITLTLFKLHASEIPFKTKITSVFLCPITVLITAAVSITALISDFAFFIGEKWFYEVPVTLIVPIILTLINYTAVYIGSKENFKEFKNNLVVGIKKLPVYIVVVISVLLAGILAYYLIRAGKSGLILPFEEKIRNVLTDIFIIRPRFKEFIIGYPAYALFVYFGFFRKNKPLSAVFGMIQIILFTSVMNTFCHASTLMWVGSLRVLTGFICGILVSGIIIGISEIIYLELNKPKKEKQIKDKKPEKQKKIKEEPKPEEKKESEKSKQKTESKKTVQKIRNTNPHKKSNKSKKKKKRKK